MALDGNWRKVGFNDSLFIISGLGLRSRGAEALQGFFGGL
jgi:hypothetical protein